MRNGLVKMGVWGELDGCVAVKAHVPPPPYGQDNALKKCAADLMSIDLT